MVNIATSKMEKASMWYLDIFYGRAPLSVAINFLVQPASASQCQPEIIRTHFWLVSIRNIGASQLRPTQYSTCWTKPKKKPPFSTTIKLLHLILWCCYTADWSTWAKVVRKTNRKVFFFLSMLSVHTISQQNKNSPVQSNGVRRDDDGTRMPFCTMHTTNGIYCLVGSATHS